MTRFFPVLAAVACLSACGDGQPFDFGGGGGTPEEPEPGTEIPTELSNNLYAVSFVADTLTIDLRSLDASDFNATYVRAEDRDIDGYMAYEYRDDNNGNGRKFLAFVQQSDTVIAAAVADGGQFNTYYGGGYFARILPYDEPELGVGGGGIARYAGSYAGIITVDTSGNVGYEEGGPVPSAIYPYQPSAVAANALIIADFTNDTVNGTIYDRVIVSEDGLTVLPETFDLVDLALVSTDIAADGTFLGKVEPLGISGTALGDYGGIFGGIDADGVGGVIMINPYQGIPTIWEHGAFVLDSCTDATCPAP